jgi:hypothetical protein
MRRSIQISAAAVLAGLGLLCVSDRVAQGATTEQFQLLEQSATVDENAGTATFRLSFDHEPRFFIPDGETEQPDSFQIEIDGDHNTFDHPILFDEIDSVIRGAEIHAGEGIPVRDREGDGGGDQAGGWGPVRALVPFELDGTTLTFTTGLETIGDQDGRFRYRLITIESGSVTSEVNAAIIPVPAAMWGGIMMLGGAGVATRLLRRLR